MAINCGSLSHPLLCPGVTWRVAGVINPDVSAAPGLATLSNGAAVRAAQHTHTVHVLALTLGWFGY